MLDLLDLVDNQLNALHETLRIMVVQNVHVHTLIAASKEGIAILIGLNAAPDSCQDKRSRIYGLKVATGHLQYDRIGCGHDCHQLCATFYTSAALICLWFISWHL
jgi:hypothetical protein